MTFLHPEALLLAIPLAVAWWLLTRSLHPGVDGDRLRPRTLVARLRQPEALLRAALLALATLLLAHPIVVVGEPGSDLIIVVDRSSSMNAEARRSVEEIIGIAESGRGEGDRVAVVAFGARGAVERLADGESRFAAFVAEVESDASELGEGIDTALGIVDAERPSRILLLSDGEATGPSAVAAAARAAARGVPIDHRWLATRDQARDVAVRSIDLPALLAPNEAFRFSATVVATAPGSTRWRLLRDGEAIASGTADLRLGDNRLGFRDRAGRPGPVRYRLELSPGDDRVPENDHGLGVTQVGGEGAVLLVTPDGLPGALGNALLAFGMRVDVVAIDRAPLDLGTLGRYRVVIMENGSALKLARPQLHTLARWVSAGGGGLLLTGGKRSFALGGWQKTPVEPLLPVSLQLRDRHRKLSVAIAFVLDRSGSMHASVGSLTKMDLANAATVAAMEQLGAQDEVAVIAVDTSPEVVVPLRPLIEREESAQRVHGIAPGGGGILVGVGLEAGAEALDRSDLQSRHVILFADAADATEPGDFETYVPELVARGIRVSVIAMGTPSDPHAPLLERIAALGEGDVHYASDAEALPQIFSSKTVAIAGASFVAEPTEIAVEPGLLVIGEIARAAPPPLGGYNLSFLKPGATRGLVSRDEEGAPILAHWLRGLGRVATFAGEVDGEHTGAFADWDGYGAFFASLVDWLGGDAGSGDLVATAERQGRTVRVTLMIDPDHPETLPKGPVELVVVPEDPARAVMRVPMRRETADELRAEYRLDDGDVRHHRIAIGERMLPVNPVTLPYSPEFESRHGRAAGDALLQEISTVSGGVARTSLEGLFDAPRRALGHRSLAPILAAALLILALLEIAWRRLALGTGGASGWTRAAAGRARGAEAAAKPERSPSPASPKDAPAPPVAAPIAAEAQRARERRRAEDLLAEAKRRSRR